jgi:hypothetical protein
MQVYRRSLARDELDHELIWLLVSLGASFGLVAWLTAGLPLPRCLFHSLTGLPCITCGATRAAREFLHGHLAASFAFNPLAFLGYCGLAVYDVYACAVISLRAPRLRVGGFSPVERRLARSLVILLLAANWLYLLTMRPF